MTLTKVWGYPGFDRVRVARTLAGMPSPLIESYVAMSRRAFDDSGERSSEIVRAVNDPSEERRESGDA